MLHHLERNRLIAEERLALLESKDWTVVRDLVEELGDELARSSQAQLGRAEIESRLVALADHESWQVRVALARAFQHLRHESIQLALSRLASDENPYVRKAAAQSTARRVEVSRSHVLREKDEVLWQRVLGKLQAQHGNAAREAACRAAEKYTELIVRATHHEIVKTVGPLDAALTRLVDALERPKVDRVRCLQSAKRVQTRFALLFEILESLDSFVREVTPVFHKEDLADMLEESIALIRERGPEERHRLRVALDVPAGLTIDAHRVRLVFAFSNLVLNALEAYEPPRVARLRIRARANDDPGNVAITFADKGCGMSDDVAANAFRLFETTKPNGGGFGLPFARKIFETEHRGAIRISSRPGKGTTMTVVLPLAQEESRS
jgi:signal transduction histidine kinase